MCSVTQFGGRSTDRRPSELRPYWPLQRSNSVASRAAPASRWARKDLTHAGTCRPARGHALCSKSLTCPDTVMMTRRHAVSLLGAIAMPHNWQSASKAESSCGDGSNGCCDGIASGLPRKVAVAGADGRTGSEVIEALRRYGVEEVIGGVRQTSKAASVPALQLQGVKVAEIDLVQGTSSDIAGALEGSGAVICCVGFRPSYVPDKDRQMAEATDNQGVCKLVDAAVEAGVDRFVLLSSLLTNAPKSDPSYRALNMLGGVLDAKHESELHLMASPLSYTIVRPGVFAAGRQGGLRLVPADTIMSSPSSSTLEERRDAGASAAAAASAKSSCVSPLAGGSSMGGRRCAVTRQQVAQVCVEALLVDPSKSCRKTVEMYADSLYDDGYGAASAGAPLLSISAGGDDMLRRRWEAL